MINRNTKQSEKNIRIKEKNYIKYLDKKVQYSLNQSWSKWKLFITTIKQNKIYQEEYFEKKIQTSNN
jgi:hypothetical protein